MAGTKQAKDVSEMRTIPDHSETYFIKRIQYLQKEIQKQLPVIDKQKYNVFVTTCRSLQDAFKSKKVSADLLNRLQKNHADDPRTIEVATNAYDAAQLVEKDVMELCSEIADSILDVLDLTKTIDESMLLECTILIQSTPKGLAEFVSKDPKTNGPLLDKFLNHPQWMKHMILYGGAANGNYGEAITIYSKILQSTIEQDDLFVESLYTYDNDSSTTTFLTTTPSSIHHKIALATALELATPIPDFSVIQKSTGFVDPVSRYWHFVHAYDKNELDKSFEKFSPWELRMVVDCEARDDEMQWGRDYLKKYRPDQLSWHPERFQYVMSVRTDLGYRQPDGPIDTYPNLISSGGECGPRAWFARFICKSFGIPSWGVRQPGHAAISRWTSSNGWETCLGGPWEYSYWVDRRFTGKGKEEVYRTGLDFRQETQARSAVTEDIYYNDLCLLECVAEIMGETIEDFVNPNKVWRSLALMQRKKFADRNNNCNSNNVLIDTTATTESKQQQFRTEGQVIPSSLISSKAAIDRLTVDMERIEITTSGEIIIPAASFVIPSKSTRNVFTMPSFFEEGLQLHLEHDGSVEYALPDNIPNAPYMLSCRLVNVHAKQVPLLLTIEFHDDDEGEQNNDGFSMVDLYRIEVEYSIGEWIRTKPIQVQVGPKSTLKFSREDPCFGLSIKTFNLMPMQVARP